MSTFIFEPLSSSSMLRVKLMAVQWWEAWHWRRSLAYLAINQNTINAMLSLYWYQSILPWFKLVELLLSWQKASKVLTDVFQETLHFSCSVSGGFCDVLVVQILDRNCMWKGMSSQNDAFATIWSLLAIHSYQPTYLEYLILKTKGPYGLPPI